MDLKRIETPGIAHFAYLLSDGGVAAVVDPQRYIDDYLEAAREARVRITHVIETHRQEDFVMGSAHLAEVTGAAIVNGDHELFGHGDLRLADGDAFEVGGLRIVALHTPGHTPESMCYAVYERDDETPWCVFTGDTLFFGDTGRTDLPDEDASVANAGLLYDSVHEKLAPLGDTTLILPAHGPGSVCGSGMAERPLSTLGEERQYNPVFTCDREAFASSKGGERLPRPPFFRHMEKVNLDGGLPPAPATGVVDLLDVEGLARGAEAGILIDTREPEAYAGGHVPRSYSVWLGGLPVFGGWVANHTSAVYLVSDRSEDIDVAARHLGRIGIDGVRGALNGGFGTWRNSGRDVRVGAVITPRQLADHRGDFVVLDVREPDEFDAGHIDGAVNVYVGHLDERIDSLPFDKGQSVVVTCGVGHRAGLGVSILLRHGFRDVRNLLGGMKAWQALHETSRGS